MQQRPRYPGGDINLPQFDFQNLNRRTIYIIFGIIGVLWLLSGIYFVDPQEEGVVRRFGEFVNSYGPGIHYHLPWPMETVDKPKVEEVKSIEIGFRTISPAAGSSSAIYRQIEEESLMLTGDENIVDLDLIVQFKIKNARDYLFNVRNPEATVSKAMEAAIRFVIGQNLIDNVLTENKTQIQVDTQINLQSILDLYNTGIHIIAVNLQDVQPPEEVSSAFTDVASAIQDKNRLINEADGYRNSIIPQARGEAEKQIRDAEAYKEERIKRSQGDADRFLSILQEYSKAKDVTRRRMYIETMEKILPGMDKYIIKSDGSGGILNLLNLQKGGGN
ncbi:FtsH protease activity modulator HflK [candidate division KSB1 bacterium]